MTPPQIRQVARNTKNAEHTDVPQPVSVNISENITAFVFQAAAFVGLFISLWLGLSIVLQIVGVICSKTILGGVNRLLGGVVGALSGLIIVWGISVIVFLVTPETVAGTQFMQWMAKSFFLSKFFGVG